MTADEIIMDEFRRYGLSQERAEFIRLGADKLFPTVAGAGALELSPEKEQEIRALFRFLISLPGAVPIGLMEKLAAIERKRSIRN